MSKFANIRQLSVVPKRPAIEDAPKAAEEKHIEGTPFASTPLSGSPDVGAPDAAVPLRSMPGLASPPPASPSATAPATATPVSSVPRTSKPGRAVPRSGVATAGGAFSSTPQPAATQEGVVQARVVLPAVIHKAVLAQHGHSNGEGILYGALWEKGEPREGDSYRLLSMGYRQMSQLTGMTVNNCKANFGSLIQKLAVEEISGYTTSQARTYKVFSFSLIIKRRKAAGLTHYIKKQGIRFVDPDSGDPLTSRTRKGIPFTGTPTEAVARRATAPKTTPERGFSGIPVPATAGIPPADAYLNRNVLDTSFSNSTTSTALRELLQAQLPKFDDKIIDRLWMKCQASVPDVTEQEVSVLFAEKLPAAFERGITSPNGFLLTAVSASCTCAAIDAMRRSREVDEAELEIVKTREEQIADLEDSLRLFPDHPTASPLWRRKLQELREGN
jgi:hypothetical protein